MASWKDYVAPTKKAREASGERAEKAAMRRVVMRATDSQTGLTVEFTAERLPSDFLVDQEAVRAELHEKLDAALTRLGLAG